MSEQIPVINFRILPEDFTKDGLVKGGIIFQLMDKSRQPLKAIAESMHSQRIWFSMTGFIEEAFKSTKFTQRECEGLLLKTCRDVLPELMNSKQGKKIKSDLKREVKRIYGQSN